MEFVSLTFSFEPGPCLALSLAVIKLFALASVCGVAVFFMLLFLRAFLREARPGIFFPERRERISAMPVRMERNSKRWDRVA
jgi:hypothetical protein